MTTPRKTSTTTLTSSESSLQRLVNKLRTQHRLPTQTEISYAGNLCEAIETQAERESARDRSRMTSLATHARQVFDLPFTRQTSDRDASTSLAMDYEADGKELVLRPGETPPAGTPPAPSTSKRQEREPNRPVPPRSVHIDPEITGDKSVLNSTNDKHDHSQTLKSPSATSHIITSAPIYNQNVNSGSGQQNVSVIGNFFPPPPPTGTTAPTEYEVAPELEHHQHRDDGQQNFTLYGDVTNKTASDNKPGEHTQTLKGPHGLTHIRATAPIYNQNVNSGSGQQNVYIKGKMIYEKQDRKETASQKVPAAQPVKLPNRTQTANPQTRRRDDREADRREPAYMPPSRREWSPRRRSRSPAWGGPRSRSGSVEEYRTRSYGESRVRERYEEESIPSVCDSHAGY